jgi:hypothetical protein
MMCPSKYSLIGCGGASVILFRAYGTEHAIVKMSEPALILADVDRDATGNLNARKTERVDRLSVVGFGEWKWSSPSKIASNYFMP